MYIEFRVLVFRVWSRDLRGFWFQSVGVLEFYGLRVVGR